MRTNVGCNISVLRQREYILEPYVNTCRCRFPFLLGHQCVSGPSILVRPEQKVRTSITRGQNGNVEMKPNLEGLECCCCPGSAGGVVAVVFIPATLSVLPVLPGHIGIFFDLSFCG